MPNLILAALPILAFYLLFKCSGATAFGDRAIRGATLWSVILVALVELASQFDAVTRSGLALGWCVVLLAVALYAVARRIRLRSEASPRLAEPRHLYWPVLAIVMLPTLAISILTLPNSWDALTYHISRVDHWIQDRSVAFYPTFFDPQYAPLGTRQNELAPLAEYVILNFRLLAGDYALANLTQWFAMVGSLIAIFSIARRLGGGERAGGLAVVFGATVPMGILQASSTQNDYCVGFWLLAFIAELLRWRQTRAAPDLVFASAALGLAVLTKGTALLFAAPFVVWLLGDFIAGFHAPLRRKAALAAICGLCALAPNLPHAMRNVATYGDPLGGATPVLVAQHTLAPSRVAVTMIRDVALNFATPDTGVNEAIARGIARAGRMLGLDLTGRAGTLFGMPFELRTYALSEDGAGNPLHTVILFVLFAALPWLRSSVDRRDRVYAGCALAGFFLFAALLQWQPWGTRLMLPGFIISAPLVGVIADRVASLFCRTAVAWLLLASALPYVLLNQTKPLIAWDEAHPPIWSLSRHATMFVHRPRLEEQFTAVAAYLRQCSCSRVGLATVEDGPTALAFRALAAQGGQPSRLEEIELASSLERLSYPLGPFSPDAVLWLGSASPASIPLGGGIFVPAFETPYLHVYRPAPSQVG